MRKVHCGVVLIIVTTITIQMPYYGKQYIDEWANILSQAKLKKTKADCVRRSCIINWYDDSHSASSLYHTRIHKDRPRVCCHAFSATMIIKLWGHSTTFVKGPSYIRLTP